MLMLPTCFLCIRGSLPTTCTNAGLISITFDDGPTNYTNEILEIADENDVKLSFNFTIHQRMSGDLTDVYKRVVESGHTLGLRVNPQRDYDNMSYEEVETDINKQIAGINKAGDTKIKFARAPEDNGSYNQDVYEVLKGDGITQVSSTFCPYIFDDPVEEFRDMIGAANPSFDSFIVQMHDYREEDDQYLQHFIDIGKENGFKFVSLDKCLGDYKPEKSEGNNSKSAMSSDGVADICILPMLLISFYFM